MSKDKAQPMESDTKENGVPKDFNVHSKQSKKNGNSVEVHSEVEEISQIMNSEMTTEHKNRLLQVKCIDLLQRNWKLDAEQQKSLQKIDELSKEKEIAKYEIVKAQTMKTKLESLCRELQKENKRTKDETKGIILLEQQKREELSHKLETTINEMKSKITEGEEYKKVFEHYERIKDQLKNLKEQYELREKHYNSVMKSKDLELKLFEAKLAQQTEICSQETQKALSYKQQIEVMVDREEELRSQLDTYAEKFDQVQDAINKSNQVFNTFKREMEQMTKKLRKMEKENESLKQKCETMNRNIIELVDERTKTVKTLEMTKSQKTKLESLCRALQSERKELKTALEKFLPPTVPVNTPSIVKETKTVEEKKVPPQQQQQPQPKIDNSSSNQVEELVDSVESKDTPKDRQNEPDKNANQKPQAQQQQTGEKQNSKEKENENL